MDGAARRPPAPSPPPDRDDDGLASSLATPPLLLLLLLLVAPPLTSNESSPASAALLLVLTKSEPDNLSSAAIIECGGVDLRPELSTLLLWMKAPLEDEDEEGVGLLLGECCCLDRVPFFLRFFECDATEEEAIL